jgi:hypothetical protein
LYFDLPTTQFTSTVVTTNIGDVAAGFSNCAITTNLWRLLLKGKPLIAKSTFRYGLAAEGVGGLSRIGGMAGLIQTAS